MTMQNGGPRGDIPDLGRPQQQRPTHIAPNIALLLREMPDTSGMVPIPDTPEEARALYMDATQLLAAIAMVVREVVREAMAASSGEA